MIIRRTSVHAILAAADAAGVSVNYSVLSPSRGGGHTISVKVNLGEDREKWRRVSPRGRRVAAVCWHGFRDFFRELFALTPNAVAKTALATYDGADGFEEAYRATAKHNIGSMRIVDACTCEDSGQPY